MDYQSFLGTFRRATPNHQRAHRLVISTKSIAKTSSGQLLNQNPRHVIAMNQMTKGKPKRRRLVRARRNICHCSVYYRGFGPKRPHAQIELYLPFGHRGAQNRLDGLTCEHRWEGRPIWPTGSRGGRPSTPPSSRTTPWTTSSRAARPAASAPGTWAFRSGRSGSGSRRGGSPSPTGPPPRRRAPCAGRSSASGRRTSS